MPFLDNKLSSNGIWLIIFDLLRSKHFKDGPPIQMKDHETSLAIRMKVELVNVVITTGNKSITVIYR